ncbi:hypothetical protein LBMAG52_22180 [Planctomycetia bacterium]|nr:hypothetical protein LBMAG52_22180 [Planctomycetia bacterium]
MQFVSDVLAQLNQVLNQRMVQLQLHVADDLQLFGAHRVLSGKLAKIVLRGTAADGESGHGQKEQTG